MRLYPLAVVGVNCGAVLHFALFVHVFSLRLAGGEILIEWISKLNSVRKGIDSFRIFPYAILAQEIAE